MDRNNIKPQPEDGKEWSLSARRAWIEIVALIYTASDNIVALRKESVDRNLYLTNYHFTGICRSPQGERG